ncbi:MAG: SDR family NAD(P)-dependent oxidoreductase [Acidobacteria bacterium]|nr:SDR family NAD(P)-dependent oxidoreductase [Acidobacteriota bacterium]
MDLQDKCAVVTGGGHGIGRALAEALAARGAKVVVADLNGERTKKIADRIGGTPVVCDVGDRDAVTELVRQATSAYGPVDVFVSNAGIGDRGPDLASTPEQIDLITRVNLLAHVWAAQEVVPSMVERGGGHLVQTISSASLITGPSGMGYTFTKHGALGFAEWVSLNYQHKGIVVTCLCPNAVNTGMMGRNEDDDAARDDRASDPVRQNIGEIVEPELCAEMTLAAMEKGEFLVLPHPRVGESFMRKANDYDAWLAGTNRRLRRMRGEEV